MTRIVELLMAHAPKSDLPGIFREMASNPNFDSQTADQMLRKMDVIDFVRIGREYAQNDRFKDIIPMVALDRLSKAA
jgi:hypothetical protein